MKTTIKFLSLILVIVLTSQIASAQVKSDYDKDADFSKYKTYTFAGWAEGSDDSVNDIDQKRILSAFKAELDARGMTKVDTDADATITLFVSVDQKTSKTAYTDYNGGLGYGGRWGYGYGYGYGGGSSTTTYSEVDYNEGTLVLDMYDSESKSLVWQGVVTAVVKTKPAKREKDIKKKISKMMKQFPIAASK
ncbi:MULTISPECIES: DUF4136 domain-containing protein [Reichenbachiella]|uniref:DUF4136 domain-containing protein n=1 Tax=Reichenbachiella agariperforans TaxID=156994 RepID=A0A1M6T1R2_REIAG|nr:MULTISPECIES: DUF4136 domain-containing protein [Reichenbachiella]MBU2914806.1 DUF4136 domain-containing protein [Reichenbachiella agariperforans]RJE75185.1 hypothetical protein BGP76_18965 [Reichenbachiella sp. MSK19-1]SHK50904.1 protein of unknown function [Reichenbachiella agariperforans]